MSVEEPLKFSDLDDWGSSDSQVRKSFKDRFHSQPDGIALNKETKFNAVTPAITDQYKHPCKKAVGELDWDPESESTPTDVVLWTYLFVNHDTDEELIVDATQPVNWKNSVSTTVGAGVKFATAEETSIKLFSHEWTVEVSISFEHNWSREIEAGTTVTIHTRVPPLRQRRVEVSAVLRKTTLAYSGIASVSGMFGANFPKPVEKHYFWFMDEASILPTTSKSVSGVVHGAKHFNIQVVYHNDEPIPAAIPGPS